MRSQGRRRCLALAPLSRVSKGRTVESEAANQPCFDRLNARIQGQETDRQETRMLSQGPRGKTHEVEECYRGRRHLRRHGGCANDKCRGLLAEPLLSPSRVRWYASLLASGPLSLVAWPPALLVGAEHARGVNCAIVAPHHRTVRSFLRVWLRAEFVVERAPYQSIQLQHSLLKLPAAVMSLFLLGAGLGRNAASCSRQKRCSPSRRRRSSRRLGGCSPPSSSVLPR
jgi:hypothetical protein